MWKDLASLFSTRVITTWLINVTLIESMPGMVQFKLWLSIFFNFKVKGSLSHVAECSEAEQQLNYVLILYAAFLH